MLFPDMSNFESLGRSSRSSGGDKHPLKRVEPAVRKFITVLRIDIDRLQKHKQNIVKVMTVQINCSPRTCFITRFYRPVIRLTNVHS